MGFHLFTNALAVILRHRDHKEEDERYYQKPKDYIHHTLFRSRYKSYFFSR